jgi:hypothetical protein
LGFRFSVLSGMGTRLWVMRRVLVAIGVKDTQDIIRQAAVLSRHQAPVPAKLDAHEVGMATGPRHRKRSLLRSGTLPDYLNSHETLTDEWQKLDDDIYKFLQIRKEQFSRLGSPPSHQFIAEMESQLKYNDPEYQLGSYLGLIRQAGDLDQTRLTFVTASERSAFHAFGRRLTQGRKQGESFDPGMVKRYQDLLDANQATTFRGLADLFRLISRATKQPLIGAMREAPAQSIAFLLHVVDVAARFNQNLQGNREFQVGPMDVFLSARTVLFNRSVVNPTLSMVKELVLDDSGLYHEDLIELLKSIGVFGSDLTMLIPESMTEEGFALKGSTYSAVDLVMAAGAKLAKSSGPVEKALSTLADAILHKVQQQDTHKDIQIQSILGHFNRLLKGERRSAARVTQDRQQARFDYMTAIQRASQLAKGMQTGEFPTMIEGAPTARPSNGKHPAIPVLAPGMQVAAAAVLAGLSPIEYENLLSSWDGLLSRLRIKLTTKSPVFKTFASQLSRVRSMDTCLAYGLTPAGGRCTSRFAKLIQGEEVRSKLGIPAEVAEAMEDAFSRDYPGFLASLESLVATLYEFKPGMQTVQFRTRDRMLGKIPPSVEADFESEGSEFDLVVLKLMFGTILLAHEMTLSGGLPPGPQFGPDRKFRFPELASLVTLGNSDPFLTYCAFLYAGKKTLTQAPLGDLDTSLMFLSRLTPEWKDSMAKKYRELKSSNSRSRVLPGLSATTVRHGWERGFERGFMAEVQGVVEEANGGLGLDGRLLDLLTNMQVDIDKACEMVEGEKLRLTRDRILDILDGHHQFKHA